MIDFFKTAGNGLEALSRPVKGSWINVEAPTSEEIDDLKKIISVSEDEVLTPLKDVDELPRIERFDGNDLIIIRTPKKVGELVYMTAPMGILLTKDYVITISYHQNDLLSEFKRKKVDTLDKYHFVLNLLLSSAKLYLRYLREIDKKSYMLEEDLMVAIRNESLFKLIGLEKGLVYFMTSLRSTEVMLKKLQKLRVLTREEDDRELLEDVIIEYAEALELVHIHSNIIGNTMETFASVISNNQNKVMKFLTSITIILMIPTLIASIYGMNISLPIQFHPNAFLITMVVSVLFSFIGVVLFWRRDLF